MRKSMTRTATALMASGLVITACSSSENGPQPKSDRIEIMYIASQTDQGVCRPEARISVDKKSTGLYKIHGENRYEDVRSNESTNIPLQFTFPGYDPDTGIAESRSTVGLNTDTPCEHLRIRARIEYCLYDDNPIEERACKIPVNLIGEGFAELVVTEDYPGQLYRGALGSDGVAVIPPLCIHSRLVNATGIAMKPRISMITLGVRDLPRAIAFYEQGLGLPRLQSPPSVAFFNLNGTWLGLFGWDDLAGDAQVSAEGDGFRGVSLAHNVASEAEVHTLMEQAEAAGATICKAPEKVFWGGYSGYFTDPDGHLWEVAHNPFMWVGPED